MINNGKYRIMADIRQLWQTKHDALTHLRTYVASENLFLKTYVCSLMQESIIGILKISKTWQRRNIFKNSRAFMFRLKSTANYTKSLTSHELFFGSYAYRLLFMRILLFRNSRIKKKLVCCSSQFCSISLQKCEGSNKNLYNV